MFNRIMIAISLSSPVPSALPYVKALAGQFGSEVHLLGLSTEPQQVWDRSLMDYVESMAVRLREENISTETSFVHGNPATEVVRYSTSNKIDLIVATGGKHSELTFSVLTSVAKRLGVASPRAMLMVPANNLREMISALKILVPLDCMDVGEAILPYVAAVAEKTPSSITLFYVNTPPFRAVPVMHSEVIGMSRDSGNDYLNRVMERIRGQGVESKIEVVDGTPAKTILKYACDNNFDLIAMATRGLSGIEGWLTGSVANRVSELAEIPVLVVNFSALAKMDSSLGVP